MRNIFLKSFAVVLVGLVGLTGGIQRVNAAAVIGSGEGSFTSLSSCDSSGGDRDCRIVSTGNGAKTQVQWGSQHSTIDFVNPSVLTAVDVGINTATDAYGVRLGQLDWYNSATLRLNSSLDVFKVKWTLGLNFSAPTGPDASGSELFNLTVKNPINPTGDSMYGFELTDLSNLSGSFSLSGITVSNFRYEVVDGAGSGTSFLGSSRGTTYWYNDESNHASLYILADFTAPVMTPVPEPEIYAMLGAGLGLMGWMARRRRNRHV
ncbi:MAG: hypothetical protein RJA24_683 [Pseudomonadota bacterium]|jgi:hypothetical protein